MSLRLSIGTVSEVKDRVISVKMSESGQIVPNVVKVLPLDLDEREETALIRVGAEVLILSDEYNHSFVIGTTSQGINLSGAIARVEQELVKIYGNDIEIKGMDGSIADSVDMHSYKINIHNAGNSLFPILAEICQAIADTSPVGGSSDGKPNIKKAEALALKVKCESFI